MLHMGRFLLQISVSCYFDRGKYKLKKGCNSNILGEVLLTVWSTGPRSDSKISS